MGTGVRRAAADPQRESHGRLSKNGKFNLHAAARRILKSRGFDIGVSDDVNKQLAGITQAARDGSTVRDLRDKPWSSIDNADSLDLDQIEVAEQMPDGSIKVIVAIADVDALVAKGTPIDKRAFTNTCSVYAAGEVFPMLPEKLSTDLTSLREGVDRLAIAIETCVNANGDVVSFDAYRALVKNSAKLAYDDVGAWLDNGPANQKIASNRVLQQQLKLQSEAAQRLKAERERNGALDLETIEATPVVKNGDVVDLKLLHKTKARDLIEDFMIASNVAIAKFLEAHGRSGIRRVVREPERWNRIVALAKQRAGVTLPDQPDSVALAKFVAQRHAEDPDHFPDLSLSIVKLLGPGQYALDMPGKDPGGHFGLAIHDYSHATAPNRRYADLVTQRLVKATLANAPAPYTNDELSAIADHCTEREDAENKVEREIRKTVAALLLHDKVGQVFDAIVTGVSDKGTYVRTLHPPAEGRVIKNYEKMDVADRVKVRLLSTEPDRGWIDFSGV